MTNQNRLVWCDAIRLLAFFMLLCCHAADPFYASAAYASAATATDPEEVQWAMRWGSLVRPCVPLFVMLTGVLSLPVNSSMEQFYKNVFQEFFTRSSYGRSSTTLHLGLPAFW